MTESSESLVTALVKLPQLPVSQTVEWEKENRKYLADLEEWQKLITEAAGPAVTYGSDEVASLVTQNISSMIDKADFLIFAIDEILLVEGQKTPEERRQTNLDVSPTTLQAHAKKSAAELWSMRGKLLSSIRASIRNERA